jgi:hypothetical protein
MRNFTVLRASHSWGAEFCCFLLLGFCGFLDKEQSNNGYYFVRVVFFSCCTLTTVNKMVSCDNIILQQLFLKNYWLLPWKKKLIMLPRATKSARVISKSEGEEVFTVCCVLGAFSLSKKRWGVLFLTCSSSSFHLSSSNPSTNFHTSLVIIGTNKYGRYVIPLFFLTLLILLLYFWESSREIRDEGCRFILVLTLVASYLSAVYILYYREIRETDWIHHSLSRGGFFSFFLFLDIRSNRSISPPPVLVAYFL